MPQESHDLRPRFMSPRPNSIARPPSPLTLPDVSSNRTMAWPRRFLIFDSIFGRERVAYDLYETTNRLEWLQGEQSLYDAWAFTTCQAIIQDFRWNPMVDTGLIMPDLSKTDKGYLEAKFWFQKYGVEYDMAPIAEAAREEEEFDAAIAAMMMVWQDAQDAQEFEPIDFEEKDDDSTEAVIDAGN